MEKEDLDFITSNFNTKVILVVPETKINKRLSVIDDELKYGDLTIDECRERLKEVKKMGFHRYINFGEINPNWVLCETIKECLFDLINE